MMSGFGLDVIYVFLAIFLLGIAILIIFVTTKKNVILNVDKYRKSWLKIENSFTKDNRQSWSMAVIEADKLLDQAMIELGISGKTMGERLKQASNNFSNKNAIWVAHKLRNQIAHKPGINIELKESRLALGAFKRGLKDLGAI